ncbi:hypothetical protein R1flu_009863 [Riccia fluitans]|uniref:Uncharacterized protein n=1 Tax=Riccia fluitans TaxID=41844 RepID=A0ABD1Z3D1_9MARC
MCLRVIGEREAGFGCEDFQICGPGSKMGSRILLEKTREAENLCQRLKEGVENATEKPILEAELDELRELKKNFAEGGALTAKQRKSFLVTLVI